MSRIIISALAALACAVGVVWFGENAHPLAMVSMLGTGFLLRDLIDQIQQELAGMRGIQ